MTPVALVEHHGERRSFFVGADVCQEAGFRLPAGASLPRFEDDVTFDDYLADFSGEFHDLRGSKDWTDCLEPDT